MPVLLHEVAAGKALAAQLSGQLIKEDAQGFVPEVERLLPRHGKIPMLAEMHDFHGCSLGALWEDIKFDRKHFSDIERLALVGGRKWEAGMAVFCKPFSSATVRSFDDSRGDDAFRWIPEGVAQPV